MEQLIAFFQNKQVDAVLDVGTGTGNFIAVLKETFPEAKIIGVDPNTDSMNEAAQLYPDVDFVEMGGENLDFNKNTFDVASISMALHHLPDIAKTFSEMKRVVKPGGWIVVNELFSDNLNPAQEVHKLMHHFRSKIDRLTGVCHNETSTKQEIVDYVEASGLKIVLHFENRKTATPISKEEIVERNAKMKDLLVKIAEYPEYPDLLQEASIITEAINEHGFEMAPRVVIVSEVH